MQNNNSHKTKSFGQTFTRCYDQAVFISFVHFIVLSI
uniref:Uncharacterized protein n=1 Tax=Anguilla anguilla TaxID=7936 RepID=A0A0E9SD88_ANGAN